MNNNRNIMLYEPNQQGHHPRYLEYFLRYLDSFPDPNTITLILGTGYPKCFAEDVKELVVRADWIKWKNIDSCDELALNRYKHLPWWQKAISLTPFKILDRYAKDCRADIILCMHIDLIISGLVLKPFPRSKHIINGILFSPPVLYDKRINSTHKSMREKLRDLIKNAFMVLCVLNPRVGTIFSLDPYFVDYIASRYIMAKKNEWSVRAVITGCF